VNTNPTRTGILDIMRTMGADIEVMEERSTGGEPVADLVVRSSRLRPAEVGGSVVPRAIDELPLVALLACFAEGESTIRDAAELRAKESDRVESVVQALSHMGVRIQPRPDGFSVQGPVSLRGGRIDARGDHRIGMLGGIAGALAEGATRIENAAVEVSYPGFWRDLEQASEGAAATREQQTTRHRHSWSSGVGGHVIDRLRERLAIHRATSSTSRPPRHYEEDGVHYHFLSPEEFERKIDAGDFIEHARVYDQWKGVERAEIEGPLARGEDVIIRTDVQGARTWRKKLEGGIFVILMAEDRDSLRARLVERGSEDAAALAIRIAELEDELSDIDNNDYVVVNRHGRLDDAIDEIVDIIERERHNPDRPPVRLLP
jgi:guanylate kinase